MWLGIPRGQAILHGLATHDVPDRSSPIVEALLKAGATLLGKTVTDELAYSLHGDNVHYGAPLNTLAPDRVSGGSSSGSVAAVAARMVDFALGTDTGGSTRVPASYCGVWGLRTTHGALPADGLVPLHPAYDTPTWMAHEPSTFLKVGEALLPPSDFKPRRILQFSDALELADDIFKPPAQQVRSALEAMTGEDCVTVRAADEASLHEWRGVYATSGAYEGWQIHGEWITREQPEFGEAIAGRWKAASLVSAEAAEAARQQACDHPPENARIAWDGWGRDPAIGFKSCTVEKRRSCRSGCDKIEDYGDHLHCRHRRPSAGQHSIPVRRWRTAGYFHHGAGQQRCGADPACHCDP
jgi:amidase